MKIAITQMKTTNFLFIISLPFLRFESGLHGPFNLCFLIRIFTSNTFVKLYRGIKNFRFQSKFSTYVFQILSRVCFDAIRTQKKHQVENLDSITSSVEPQTDLKMQLEHAIAQLPERMRLCFVLFAVEEFKVDEIAVIMNMTTGGVKSTLFQARVRLRKIFDIWRRNSN